MVHFSSRNKFMFLYDHEVFMFKMVNTKINSCLHY